MSPVSNPQTETDPQTEAFRLFYEENYANFVRFAARQLRDTEYVEDIVSEVFITLWSKWDKIGGSDTEKLMYGYRVARNRCIDAHRRDQRAQAYVSKYHEGADPPDESERGTVESAEKVAVSNIQADSLYKSMYSALSDREREVILMYSSGYRPNEIAKRLGTSAATVRTYILRSRKKLRRSLARSNPDVLQYR
ncbi:RNA polymerase sigma factor [Streptomyces nigra]|uniref:RNA polymerase sigma factor n=1 Tax=Streptomyces nigra TaxID=1827580 RepID=UPI0013DD8EAD|nr:sigma-70 family RNA polymerase sigma factor [Streptomyces nigra]